MKVLIVYDSVFGNTGQIAREIGKSLGTKDETKVAQVLTVKPEDIKGTEVLVAGSPTRAFSPTKAMKTFLNKIPSNSLKNKKVAAFDTRMEPSGSGILAFLMKVFGYAALPIGKKLQKKGGNLVIEPEGFIVTGTEGPLKDGELKRADEWARQITRERKNRS
jgi:flavodoxin